MKGEMCSKCVAVFDRYDEKFCPQSCTFLALSINLFFALFKIIFPIRAALSWLLSLTSMEAWSLVMYIRVFTFHRLISGICLASGVCLVGCTTLVWPGDSPFQDL